MTYRVSFWLSPGVKSGHSGHWISNQHIVNSWRLLTQTPTWPLRHDRGFRRACCESIKTNRSHLHSLSFLFETSLGNIGSNDVFVLIISAFISTLIWAFRRTYRCVITDLDYPRSTTSTRGWLCHSDSIQTVTNWGTTPLWFLFYHSLRCRDP